MRPTAYIVIAAYLLVTPASYEVGRDDWIGDNTRSKDEDDELPVVCASGVSPSAPIQRNILVGLVALAAINALALAL